MVPPDNTALTVSGASEPPGIIWAKVPGMVTAREAASLVKSTAPLPVMVTGDAVTPLTDKLKLRSAVVTGLAALWVTPLVEPDAAPVLTTAPVTPTPSTPAIPAHATHLDLRRRLIRSPDRCHPAP